MKLVGAIYYGQSGSFTHETRGIRFGQQPSLTKFNRRDGFHFHGDIRRIRRVTETDLVAKARLSLCENWRRRWRYDIDGSIKRLTSEFDSVSETLVSCPYNGLPCSFHRNDKINKSMKSIKSWIEWIHRWNQYLSNVLLFKIELSSVKVNGYINAMFYYAIHRICPLQDNRIAYKSPGRVSRARKKRCKCDVHL